VIPDPGGKACPMMIPPRANWQTTARANVDVLTSEKYKGLNFGRMSPIVIWNLARDRQPITVAVHGLNEPGMTRVRFDLLP
jgi:hypothetical protein